MSLATTRVPTFPARADAAKAGARPYSAARYAADARWLTTFVSLDVLAQVGMFFFGGSAALRLPMRMSVYVGSLCMLLVTLGRSTKYPPRRVLPFILGVLALEQLHPDGDRPFAQTAQLVLYTAVLSPLIWGPRLRLADPFAMFRRVVLILWLFYTASAIVGVLQVRYPGRFEGALSANFAAGGSTYDKGSLAPHMFKLADGKEIIRPRGLTDVPGGAAVGGVYSILFGMGLLTADRRIWLRALAVGGMVAGLFCIYICQGRTNLVIVALSAGVLLAVLLMRGSVGRASILATMLFGVASVGTAAAFAIGGASTVARFNTLLENDASTVVYDSRGKFIELMLREDVPNYPLGAGMGRWGMMHGYFGGNSDPLWAEMMWQALIFDGGLILILAYAALLIVVVLTTWKVALRARDDALGSWAGAICGCNLAAVAASFVFPIFAVSMGLEIFVLNACLYPAFVEDQRRPR